MSSNKKYHGELSPDDTYKLIVSERHKTPRARFAEIADLLNRKHGKTFSLGRLWAVSTVSIFYNTMGRPDSDPQRKSANVRAKIEKDDSIKSSEGIDTVKDIITDAGFGAIVIDPKLSNKGDDKSVESFSMNDSDWLGIVDDIISSRRSDEERRRKITMFVLSN